MAFWSNISAILFLVALILLILCIISFFKRNGKAMTYGRPAVICFIISFLVMITSTEKTDHPIINFFANVCLILFIFFLVLAILSIVKKTGMAKKQFLITAVLFIAFGVFTSIATPFAEKLTAKDKKIATEKEAKKDAEKKEADEKTREQEEEKRQAEEQAQKQQKEQKRQAEEQALKQLEEHKNQAEEQTQKQQEEQKRQAEEQALKQLEEHKHQAEEQTQKQQEEQKRQAEEQAQKQQEEQKRQAEEQAQKQQEEQKRQAEEQAQKQQEEQKRQAEEQASQKKSTVASSATSNHGGSNGQPFQNDPSDDKETNTSCKGQIKGNANSKKYHVPGGQYYDSTKDNIVWFCSEADAKAAGYVKSKK
ncbi:sunset domain-containing protein [Bacillus pseudomycoides]|uniref:sunset domain-containing protein n=1 Tax=Bacillus pseudomycoides TaxID=64104 RepID=UPI000BECE801|nr:calcium-binding protein [Bacillus pseudomycoides]PED06936.1 calcium-binding protein [Bacillus pseudomycoides]PEI98909.1 calcium-binding protein [Bacillus pseudomycoides]PEK29765.1 calcium-binding protein [Bacillus pseudomycoides]PEM68280.1 calcium-binding protein [Bacillus pseudomycoides]PEO15651.1 calcium-binding protein [Bacillus pseudomycoides]